MKGSRTAGQRHRACLAWIMVFVAWFGTACPVAPAQEDKTTTVDITVVLSGPPATLLPAGDVDTHTVGLGQKQGKALFSDGRQADYSNVFYLDWYRGQSATMTGYSKMVFSDDAWIFIKWDSRFTGLDDAGNPVLEGVGTLMKGTGPYQGIEGTVKFINRQLPPNSDHPKGARQAKATMIYRLP